MKEQEQLVNEMQKRNVYLENQRKKESVNMNQNRELEKLQESYTKLAKENKIEKEKMRVKETKY